MDAAISPRMVIPISQRAKASMETLPHRRAKDFLALGEVVYAQEEGLNAKLDQALA